MKKVKMLAQTVFMLFIVFGFVSQSIAVPIVIKPDSGILNTSRWQGKAPGNPSPTEVAGIVGVSTLTEYYKVEYENGISVELGSLNNSYEGFFDGSSGQIAFVDGSYIDVTGGAYLLVKDGQGANIDPWWYIFDLKALGWNGTETIQVDSFWTGQGAISHLSLLGTKTAVPEPTTILLLGLGMVGLAGAGRKFKK